MDAKPAIYDLLIIGGGINGVGIAAHAAQCGLAVLLCEQNDLASATSSASSKLIHGGLRYLENLEFNLVRKALKEREILLKKAPHLIRPLQFILPHEKHSRPAWMIKLGLFLYDHLATHPSLPNSKKIDLKNAIQKNDLLTEFKLGFSYYDCLADDARLVIANAMSAKEHGATIFTQTELLSAVTDNDIWKITLKNKETNELKTYYTKAVINAAGPWVNNVNQLLNRRCQNITTKLVKGSHIIVPRLYTGDYAYILQHLDKRIVFSIPYLNDFTLIGTTDVNFHDDPAAVNISEEEENYLCKIINQYFQQKISRKDIVSSYSGVRCLQDTSQNKLSKISRDYHLLLSDPTESPLLLTVIGGKITTYRCLALEAINKIRFYFPHADQHPKADLPLPGGENIEKFTDFSLQFKDQYPWLPEQLIERYARNYGYRVFSMLNGVASLKDLGRNFAPGLYQKEVEYLVEHEWARRAEDILWRRTKIGLFCSSEEVQGLQQWLQTHIEKKL